MPSTSEFVVANDKSLLGFEKLTTYGLDYAVNFVKKVLEVLGNGGAWLDDGTGNVDLILTADKVAISTDRLGFSGGVTHSSPLGSGHILLTKTSVDVVGPHTFPNVLATVYSVGASWAEVPTLVEKNVRTSGYQYARKQERLGYEVAPDLVTDNGNGTITLRVNTACGATGTHAGRKVRVWLGNPLTTSPTVAFEEVAVVFSGGNNQITTAAALGQSVIATNATLYRVMLIGPRITASAFGSGDLHIGNMTGAGAGNVPTAKDLSLQPLLNFGLANMTSVLRKDSHGFFKIRIKADASDADEKQLEVQTSGGVAVFQVDEDGDVTLGDGATVPAGRLFVKVQTGQIWQLLATATTANLAHTGTDVLYVLTSAGTGAGGGLQFNRRLEATNVMLLRDSNIPSDLPVSAASPDNNLDTAFQVRAVLNAVNSPKRLLDGVHANAILSGAGITYPGGLVARIAAGTYLLDGAYWSVAQADFTVTDAATRFLYLTTAGALGEAATTAAVPAGAVILYRVTAAAGSITTSATIDLRLFSALAEYRSSVLVGPIDTGTHFATVGEAVAFVKTFGVPNSANSRAWEIRVLGSTTETAAIALASGLTIRGLPNSNAAVKWSGNFHLFTLSALTNVHVEDLVIESTHASDDAAAVSRAAFQIDDVNTNVRLKNLRFVKSAGSSAHAFIYPTATGELDDSTVEDCDLNGASDLGVYLKAGYRNVFRGLRLNQADTVQNTTGSGIRIDAGRLNVIEASEIEGWDKYGIHLAGATETRISHVGIRNTGDHGLLIDASSHRTICISVHTSGVGALAGALGTAYGIHLKSGQKCKVSLCDLNTDATPTTKKGLRIDAATATDFAIVTSNQTNALTIDNQNGVNTTVANNRDDA